MGTRLLDFAKTRNEIRQWAGLLLEQPTQPISNNQRTTTERPRHGEVHSARDFLEFEDNM